MSLNIFFFEFVLFGGGNVFRTYKLVENVINYYQFRKYFCFCFNDFCICLRENITKQCTFLCVPLWPFSTSNWLQRCTRYNLRFSLCWCLLTLCERKVVIPWLCYEGSSRIITPCRENFFFYVLLPIHFVTFDFWYKGSTLFIVYRKGLSLLP